MTCPRPRRRLATLRAAPSLLLLSLLAVLLHPSAALLHLRSGSLSFTFIDAPARFAVPVDGSGICGSLHFADPAAACSPFLPNGTSDMTVHRKHPRFALIARGDCSFEKKIRIAQDGGFSAAIIYDDKDKGGLYSMIGNSFGIHIHAVFVSKLAGETLKKFARGEEGECCLGPSMDETAGTVLVISFVSLLVIVSVVAIVLFVRNLRLLRHARYTHPSSIDRKTVEALPCIIFKTAYLSTKHKAEHVLSVLKTTKMERP